MNEPRLIGPEKGTTPGDLRSSRGYRRQLPDDLLENASRRLAVISLTAIFLWTAGTILFHVATAQTDPKWWGWQTSDWLVVFGTVVSIGMFVYARSGRGDPEFVLDLGLVYLVLTALLIGLMSHWEVMANRVRIPLVSWIGVLVLIFAAIVPTSRGKMLVAGLIAVSMNPLGMIVGKARGVVDASFSEVVVMHYQDYLIALVAVVISHVVTGLGREVAKARELGSYRLGELLGRGGMGEVYKATHRMLARPAAIKLIRPEAVGAHSRSAADTAIVRFRREATAAANLRSPHTVELYDFGITDDGTLYFAMELLEGMDLESLVRLKGPQPAARVIHILRQVCESLEEAHAAGLVHRDIKPANIHLGRLGLQQDFVKVLDFGLVKNVGAPDVTRTNATVAGLTVGTPAYMAPEMALGKAIDGRADVYAVGCVAYFLLTGRLVFEGEEGLQMLVKRLNEDPPPPSSRTELPIPAEVERIIMACLGREPGDRPDASTLARALAAIPVTSWTEEQAREWWAANQPSA
jgi:tRNA A-37 threonylcarbamoyl transferase component Bud32